MRARYECLAWPECYRHMSIDVTVWASSAAEAHRKAAQLADPTGDTDMEVAISHITEENEQ